MSNAEQFIQWYAQKINETDLVSVRNKLFAIRSKNMNMYNFLVEEFQNSRNKSSIIDNSQYQIVKSGDFYRAKPIKKPTPIKTTMQTRMAFDSSIRDSPSPKRSMCTTNMAASVNVPPQRYQISTDENSPVYQTKMLGNENIPHHSFKYEDELKELEMLALQKRKSKKITSTENIPNRSLYTMMEGDENVPVRTRMALSSNIPKDSHRLRFLKGENLNSN